MARMLDALPLVPVFLSYVLSFVYVGIYWNNHHHMLHTCTGDAGRSCGRTCTCCSGCRSFPFATGWMGENHFAAAPSALYGAVLLLAPWPIWYFSSRSSRLKAPIRN